MSSLLFVAILLVKSVVWALPVGDRNTKDLRLNIANRESPNSPRSPGVYIESCSNMDFADLVNYISDDSDESRSPEFDILKEELSQSSPENLLEGLGDFIFEVMTPESAPSVSDPCTRKKLTTYTETGVLKKRPVSPEPLDYSSKNGNVFKKPHRSTEDLPKASKVRKVVKPPIIKENSETDTADESDGEELIYSAVKELEN